MFNVITEILNMFIKIIDIIIEMTDRFTNNLKLSRVNNVRTILTRNNYC